MTPGCSNAKCWWVWTLVSCSEAFNYLPTEVHISFSCGLFVKAWVCPKLSFKIHDIFPITAHRPAVELGIPVKQVENCVADVRSRDSSNHQGKWFAFIFRHGWLGSVKCIVVTKIFLCILYNELCPTEHFLFWVCHNHDLSKPCFVTTITWSQDCNHRSL